MPTSYTLNLSLSPATARALTEVGSHLVALLAVRVSGPGLPLLWLHLPQVVTNIQLQWQPFYAAFTAPEPLAAGTVVTPTQNRPLTLGQQLLLTTQQPGQVVDGTLPAAIELNNQTNQAITSGLSLADPQRQHTQPICAFTLHGNNLLAIEPLPQVLLAFTTEALTQSQALTHLLAQSVLVDLSVDPTASLAYDLDTGWQLGDASAQLVEAGAPLTELLVRPTLDLPA